MSREKIDITGSDLVAVVKAAYELSRPQGMGLMHFTPGPLSDEQAQQIVDQQSKTGRIALSLDYVNGRAVKLTVFREDDKLFVYGPWFDHTEAQFERLLGADGIVINERAVQ